MEAREMARITDPGYDERAIVDCPRRQDCLLGKGRLIMKHPGNVDMRHFLEARLDRWESAGIKEKAGVSWEVVHEVKQNGGRFLKEDPNGWYVEVDDEVARQKVSIGFRDLVKRTRMRQEIESHRRTQRQEQNHVDSAKTSLESDTYDFVSLSAESFPKRRKLNKDCFGLFPWAT
jgi:hypothetical protein